jgi:hypothetical protein
MSIVHLNQIRTRLETLFTGKVDMSDQTFGSETFANMFLSRSLAAYAVHHLSECSPEDAAKSIVDGSNDNGIDAIFFDQVDSRLYVVQSKWIQSGKGEPDNGSVKKFTSGIRDLLFLNFDRFNSKIQGMADRITESLTSAGLEIVAVLVHTGTSSLAEPSSRDFQDLLNEVNDPTEVLTWRLINQGALHQSLTDALDSPITAEVALRHWGQLQEPQLAIYGQVNAADLAKLWMDHPDRLVARNLRGSLGDTEVNNEIRSSLVSRPELFWYLNNGVTATASNVEKLAIGGGRHDFGVFRCEGINIVNGAQTVSTIGRYVAKMGTAADLSNCYVQFRVVSLQDAEADFGNEVTRTNNRQNKIEARDFVSQDSEQQRIRAELAISGIQYQIMRSDDLPRGKTVFDLQDSTAALACASGNVALVVSLKSQIGKLWEDIQKAPYRILFNESVSGLHVWNCIQTQRMIDAAIDTQRSRYSKPKESKILMYGNRVIAALVFKNLSVRRFGDPTFRFENEISEDHVAKLTVTTVYQVVNYVHRFYGKSMIPTLFKNQTKCRDIYEHALGHS